MANLEFKEEGSSTVSRRPKKKSQSFADRLISWGLAKDEAQANLYLIGFVIIGFGLIIYINFGSFGTPAEPDFVDPALGI